ncbi:MAG TPA: F0F1 ATP synthase subunit A [Thermomicrobiales bacterium]|nr:F0F1 ATP synthase subunit A [Thermomicrobiales bacterium]
MDVHVSIAAETLFHIGPLPVTNSFLMMLIVMAALILVGAHIARTAKLMPGRLQASFEILVDFLLEIVDGTAGRAAGRKIFPLIGGIFIFIAFANYLGVFPGVGTIGYYETEPATAEEHAAAPGDEIAAVGAAAAQAAPAKAESGERVLVPFVRSPNADLNMTVAMALVSFVAFQWLGIRQHGVGGRLKHLANPPLLFPIEIISELGRIISLSARLFGNVFAGEILLTVMYAMVAAIKVAVIPLAIPVVFIGLELLFGTIQALVFALLSLVYIVLATEGGHDDEHAAAHASAPAAPQPQAHGAD